MTQPAARPRIAWADTGRGIAIVLVVLYHSAQWLKSADFDVDQWLAINDVLSSLRMPLFFALSGLFAGKWLTAGWRSLWQSKIQLYLWVFLLWEIIGSASLQLGLVMQDKCCGVKDTVVGVLLSPVLPRFELWFIWALAIFFVVAKATRRVDYRIQLVITAVISAFALSGWDELNVGWSGMAKYYFFFLVGIYLRDWVIRLGATGGPVFIAASIAAWFFLSLGMALLDLKGIPGLYFLNCVAGLVGGVALSRTLSFVEGLGALGRKTLPVYLAHTSFILVIALVLWLPIPHALVSVLAPILPPVVAALAIYLCLVLYRIASRGRLRYLYDVPQWPARRPRLREVAPPVEERARPS